MFFTISNTKLIQIDQHNNLDVPNSDIFHIKLYLKMEIQSLLYIYPYTVLFHRL